MKLDYVPLLPIQRELQGLPRNYDRFRQYLRTMLTRGGKGVELPPLMIMNPMGKDHVKALLDAYLVVDWERSGCSNNRSIHSCQTRCLREVSMIHSRRVLLAALAAWLFASGAAVQDKKPQTIEGWGTVTDPVGDCTVKLEKRKLTISVPGGTHDLNQAIGGMKAPRVLQEIEGDFTAQVKVTGEFKPGEKAAEANTRPFNSGGLLLWQDEKNYLRLERNTWWAAEEGKYACFPPLVEQYRDGEYQDTNPPATLDEFFKGRSTWLKLERRADKLIASYSHDGKEWTEAKEITVDLPKKLHVGVAVVNTSAETCAVEFEELKIAAK